MRTILPLCAALLACTDSRSASVQSSDKQPATTQSNFSQPARDRLRRELASVIEVVRLPASPESVWVALVRKDAADTVSLARFNRAFPYFLTWALGNTPRDYRALLASLPVTAPAPAILYDSLVADTAFTRTVIVAVGFFRGTALTNGRREYPFDSLVTFATRFFHLETDSSQRIVFSLCAKSEQLRKLPMQRALDLEAWLYSFLRPAIEMDSLPATRTIVRNVMKSAPTARTRATLDSLEEVMWQQLAAEPEFRNHIKTHLDGSSRVRMFSYRMSPDRPWADALVQTHPGTGIARVPDSVRSRFKLDTSWYAKYVDAGGIPVIASARVPDEALFVARDIMNHMLSRADVRAHMIKKGARVGIMANSDSLLDLPEHRDWNKPSRRDKRLTDQERARYDQPGGIASLTARGYWNRRARGMGGAYTTCAEENLLGYPGTADFGEHILVHEFAHSIHQSLRSIDKKLVQELEDAYDNAKMRKMYLNARGERNYAVNTLDEYWAEGTQWWYWSNYPQKFVTNGTEHTVWSPSDLERYDPKLYSILSRVYADHRIPADVYSGKMWRLVDSAVVGAEAQRLPK